MNWISILIIVLIAAGFFASVRYSRRHGGCGHNCRGCSMNCKKKK